MLDPRLLRVSIETNNEIKTYEGLAITAKGVKSGSFLQNECTITIANIDKSTRDFLLTEGNPYNRLRTLGKRSSIIVEAGRESSGYFVVYRGDIVTVGLSQPPDITIEINALTANFFKGDIVSRTSQPEKKVSEIAQQIADDLGVSLQFEANDKFVSNWNFTGAAEKQVEKLYYLGDYDSYVDDDKLIVINRNSPLINRIRLISQENGLIGIPQFIDNGVRVKFFVDNYTRVGSLLRIYSKIYPASNGDYRIIKLSFDLSNRDVPFYYIADATRI